MKDYSIEIKEIQARIKALNKEAKAQEITPKKRKYKRVKGNVDIKISSTSPKVIRAVAIENKRLPKSKASQKQLLKDLRKAEKQAIKNLDKQRTKAYQSQFKETLKQMRSLTLYNKLQAEYNRAVRKANDLGINKGFQLINIKSLKKQGFKVTPENITSLMNYMRDFVKKMNYALHDPNMMMSTLIVCITKSMMAGFENLSNRIAAFTMADDVLEILSTSWPLYSTNFANWIEELYYSCNVDEDKSNQLMTLIEDQAEKIRKGE